MEACADGSAQLSILLIEDSETIIEFLTIVLTYEGFAIHVVRDGREAMAAFERVRPHLVLLDIMLPGIDGITLCRSLRARSDVAIIMLTARGDLDDRIAGLDSGADDYLPKPFKFAELLARIRAVLRRHQIVTGSLLTAGALALNRATREVTDGDRRLSLTPREFAMLEYFMGHPRQVLTRDAILNRVWGFEQAVDTNIVDVYVRHLRGKLDDDAHARIQAVRGVGYTLQP
ncbi:MAG: response regulator transcription factor [Chloroflexota bacterium]|nr:response regulator transcription factor [Chloroflexota bacterium]